MCELEPAVGVLDTDVVSQFPDLARKYRVTGVPKTVINDQIEILGGLPQDDFIQQALGNLQL